MVTLGAQPATASEQEQTTPRICYYDGKKYSEGAIVEMEGVKKQCHWTGTWKTYPIED
jgi:hypothetical protein